MTTDPRGMSTVPAPLPGNIAACAPAADAFLPAPLVGVLAEHDHRSLARPNIFEIDLGVVARNTARVRTLVGPRTFFFATVKANAYGYGIVPGARTVLAAGADALSLANLDDAALLRDAGVGGPILLYAGAMLDRAAVRAMEALDVIPSLWSEEAVDAYLAHATRRRRIALKIEVGPERLGIAAERTVELVRRLREHPHADVYLLHCHPTVVADPTHAALDWQYRRFESVLRSLEREGITVPLAAMASSRVMAMTGRAMILSAVDPGASVFAADADGRTPFHALRTRLLQARAITRTEYVEDSPIPLRPGLRVGVIPIGYSDGMARLHAGAVLIRGRRVPLLSPPSLEYTRIDLTDVPDAALGDEVVIIGRQGAVAISAEDVRQAQGASRVQDLALEVRASVVRHYRAA